MKIFRWNVFFNNRIPKSIIHKLWFIEKTSSNFCTILSGFKTRRISARLLTSLVVGSVVVRQTRLSNIIGAMEPRDVFLPLQQSQLFNASWDIWLRPGPGAT